MALELRDEAVEVKMTAWLRGLKNLRAKTRGARDDSIESAGYYARKNNVPMYVYLGNSFMHAVWRVTYKRGEALNAINNMGDIVFTVAPDLEIKAAYCRPDKD